MVYKKTIHFWTHVAYTVHKKLPLFFLEQYGNFLILGGWTVLVELGARIQAVKSATLVIERVSLRGSERLVAADLTLVW